MVAPAVDDETRDALALKDGIAGFAGKVRRG
jgi:hypothetical protein